MQSSNYNQCRNSPLQQEQDDPSQETQFASSSSQEETLLLGFVIVNIVGVQYYSGTISGRELVGLIREPLNPYDPNAIKVLNMRLAQVGHIKRDVAAVLAPLIDSNLIVVEGVVPNSPGLKTNRYMIPCQVHIFARAVAFQSVQLAISRGGLQLISDSSPSFALSEAAVVKEKTGKKGKKGKDEVRSVDEIFKLLDENEKKRGKLEGLEPPKDVITSQLFQHQKEGLGWLVHRENSADLPPFWEEKDGAFVNVLTNYQTNQRPEPLRGGVFADDMGLGKTLTLLSLIAHDKRGNISQPSRYDDSLNAISVDELDAKDEMVSESANAKKRKRGGPSKKDSAPKPKRKTSMSHIARGKVIEIDNPGLKNTLIVCPPSVISTWVAQLSEHTKSGSMKVYLYYGERTNNPEELQKYDIVLTTYSTLANEGYSSILKIVFWWRVILDEAHLIKNVNARQSQMVTSLKATRRWVVTGTPIQNGTFDLFSLMAFLQFEPFSIKSYWQSLVQRPLSQGNQKALLRLQVLMETISLRRTKDKDLVGLPPKTIEIFSVELSGEERALYDELEEKAKAFIKDYISRDRLMINYSGILSILLRLRQICTDAALCPEDVKLLFPSNSFEDISSNPELLEKMVAVLQDGEDLDCPICISPPTEIIMTRCAHLFCRSCILKTLKCSNPCCPLCRRPLTESDLFLAPPESVDTENSKSNSSRTASSSKVSALIALLSDSREKSPATKSVVFSQFRKMLILLEGPLRAAGFNFLRLDGTMDARRRASVIEEFSASGPGPTVLLASLKASGAGINLTAASRVYLFEPWWNPAVEEQAMDRVHRIGQKEDVKIVRFIVQNSIEERILELQERKKKLASEAFRRKRKDTREVNADDLRLLMAL